MPNDRDGGPTAGDPRSNPEFEALLAGYVEQLNLRGFIDPEQIREDHPLLGSAILEDMEAYIELQRGPEEAGPLGTLGDYTLRRRIGRGGMGIVYDAWQQSMERPVALKVLPPAIAADEKAFHRFMREARAAGKLNHPNVVPVYAVGQDDKTPFYAMELVEGKTLDRILARIRAATGKEADKLELLESCSKAFAQSEEDDGPGAHAETPAEGRAPRTIAGSEDVELRYWSRLAAAFAGAADGLHHAHSRGIVHRDIKPSNLILDGNGRIRILDFGLARQEGLESLTATGAAVGTPLYMSPEQAQARRVEIDHRTDIYSLGTTLYEMLAERPPFQGKSHQDTLAQIISRDPESPRKLRPRLPRDLDTIVMKCLRKNPKDRFGTAEALAQDLRRFVRGEPIEARPQAPIERLLRRAKRHALRIGAAVLLVLLAGVSALLVHQYRVRLAEGRAVEELKARAEYRSRIARAVSRIQIGEMNQHLAMNSPHRSDPADLFTGLRLDAITAPPSREELDEALLELELAAAAVPPGFDGHEACYHWARALDLRGEPEAALQKIEHLLAIRPDFVPGLVLAAEIHRALGRDEEAEAAESGAQKAAAASSSRWARTWYESRRAERERRWGDAAAAYGILMDSTAEDEAPYEGFSMESRLRHGQARLAAKEPAGALADFSIASHVWPDAMEPRLYLGRVLHMQGDKEAARRTFLDLHASRPEDQKDLAAAWIVLAYLYGRDWEAALDWSERLSANVLRERLRSYCLTRLRRFEEAEQAARAAVALDGGDAGAHHMLAVALHGQKKYDVAKESCRRAIELDPGHFGAYHTMGQLHYDWGEIAESVRWYEQSLERNPRNPATLSNLGTALVRMEKVDEGRRLLEESYAILPSALCCASLALTHGIQKRPGWERERRRLLEEAIRLDPECWMALANYGADLYMTEGRLLEGLEKLRRAVELNPDWHLAHAHLGRIYERLGLDEDAVEHYLTAAERVLRDTTPGDVQLGNIMRLGNTMAKASEHPEVRAKGIELLGGAAGDARYARVPSVVSDYASALLANERYEEALAAFDRSVEIDRKGAYALANRGICLGKLGRPAEALADFLESVEPGGEERFAYVAEHLADLFREHRDGDFGEALDRLRARLGEYVAAGSGRAEAVWNVWLMVALWLDRKELAGAFAELDALAAKAPESGGEAVRARAAEVRWALERLGDDGAIRINCGGGEHGDANGVLWHGDRFFAGGLAHDVTEDAPPWSAERERISAAGDPAIYRTVRRFTEKAPASASYCVPVLPGDYRVTLHFVEMYLNPSQACVFDVKIEGKTVLEKHKPQRAGVAAADRRTFEIEGADALLEILFVPVREAPQICAIEIERRG